MDRIHDNMSEERNITKIVLIGDSGVGKTSIVNRLVNSNFSPYYKKTMGFNVITKRMTFDKNVKLITFIDFSGQKNFSDVRKAVYCGIDLVFAVCDLSRQETIDSLENYWLPEFLQFNISTNNQPPIVQIIGNKTDLTEKESYSRKFLEECKQKLEDKFLHELIFRPCIKISAKIEQQPINSYTKPRMMMLL